jgi:hypothetical protein
MPLCFARFETLHEQDRDSRQVTILAICEICRSNIENAENYIQQ